jgi:flagellar biosynthesis/type III secretory pathway chaperone
MQWVTMSDLIKNARVYASNLGKSELRAVLNNEHLQELFKQKQALVAEMNQAKRAAADLAAEPYLEVIEEIDQTYSILLKMISVSNK